MKLKDGQCPRCGHPIPNDAMPGAYAGATSRTDNDTEVCSWCGQHEAMEQTFDHDLTPQSEWLVNVEDRGFPVDDYRLVLLGKGRDSDRITLGLSRLDHEFRQTVDLPQENGGR